MLIPGSLRRDSLNNQLLALAESLLPPGTETFEAEIDRLSGYNEDRDNETAPLPVKRFREKAATADAILMSTAEYNGSAPGGIKNALDWLSRPRGSAVLEGLPVAILGASPSPHAAQWAREQLQRVVEIAGGKTLSTTFGVGEADKAIVDGQLTDPAKLEELKGFVAEFVALIG